MTSCRTILWDTGALFCWAIALFAPPRAKAGDILWTGPTTNFTQSADSLVDELIPGKVSLTRAYSQWLYNPDAGDQGPGPDTPTDTEWAFGTLDNYQALYYQPFVSYRSGGDFSSVLVGNPMVAHLINEDVYLAVTFSQWPQHGGFFAYARSTPGVSGPTGPVLSAAGITNGLIGFDFTATAGATYVVQGSSNLMNWTALATNVATTNTLTFSDLVSSNRDRFYRVSQVTGP